MRKAGVPKDWQLQRVLADNQRGRLGQRLLMLRWVESNEPLSFSCDVASFSAICYVKLATGREWSDMREIG